MLNFKSYSQLAKDIRFSIHNIPLDVDLIVGVPRSGMIPAFMIGAFLNKPVSSMDEYLAGIKSSKGERPLKDNPCEIKKVLIVEDSVNSGKSLGNVKQRILKYSSDKVVEYLFYAAYVTSESKNLVDIYAVICEQPRVFQWNYLYHDVLSKSCFDIDGVLCVDPMDEENDDGLKYTEFILNAKPLYIPNYRIRALVTSRLEKYRSQTEEWLRKNNVQYDQLYMLDLKNKEERIKLKAYSSFKAAIYNKLVDCILFIESDRKQAMDIATKTGKNVICLSTDEMFPCAENEFKCDKVMVNDVKSWNLDLESVLQSKSFRLGNLFFRSMRNPYKILTFPVNLLRILLQETVENESKNKVLQYCIICNSKVHFNDFGNPARNSVLCPNCNSLERHRFLFFIYAPLFLGIKEKIKLLHMAPEKSLYDLISGNSNIDYIAADIDPSGYSFVNCKKEDFTKLSFENKTFDVILTNHILEHIEDEKAYLSEMRRCLRDDGVIVLSVPMDKKREITYEDSTIVHKEDRRVAFGQDDHVRIYGKDIIKRFESSGFRVYQIEEDIFPKEFIHYNKFESADKKMIITSGYFILKKELS